MDRRRISQVYDTETTGADAVWSSNRGLFYILAFEGDSHVEWFEGNFEAYEEDKRRRLGDAADRPTRLAYKKLTR